MPINPVHFAHSVCKEFLRYLNSAFPLSDPDLSAQFKRLLDAPTALDIPLAKGPYVSLSEAFAKGEGTPSNTREAQLQRILIDHHFPAGKCRERINVQSAHSQCCRRGTGPAPRRRR